MRNRRKIEDFSKIILEWANGGLRDFPWRRTKNPYEILLAEIMLQRTRANQVAPVFQRFIKKYSDVHSLSSASLSEITEEIRSLGLEKRAMGLKKLAEQLVVEYSGVVPNNKEDLLKLYGVGQYVANAILCHAFGMDVPTVDANFARILVRVFSLEPKYPAQKDKMIWKFAEAIMPFAQKQARSLNLAILDLASKFCTPKKPSCDMCPINAICEYAVNLSEKSVSQV